MSWREKDNYPEWLVTIVSDALETHMPDDEPEWSRRVIAKDVLDALQFHPEMRAFIRNGRVHKGTHTWETTLTSPEEHERRRAVLYELMKLEDELDDDGN